MTSNTKILNDGRLRPFTTEFENKLMLRFLRTSTNLLVEARTRSRARQATAGQAPETVLASELSRGDSLTVAHLARVADGSWLG